MDENFFIFKNNKKFIKTIKTCIQSENYSIDFDKKENAVIFGIKNEIFQMEEKKLRFLSKNKINPFLIK